MSSAGINVELGGLVGFNAPGSIIFGSSASGDVIATAGVNKGGEGCSFSNSCQHVSVGGLVGDNLGTIASSFAIGDVFVGANGTAGGASSVSIPASSPTRARAATSPARLGPAAPTATAAAPRSAGSSASTRV